MNQTEGATGQVSDIIGLHISRNDTKHVYMQSPEEGLIQKYKILCATHKNWSNIEHTAAGGIFAKQNELLSQDYMFTIWQRSCPQALTTFIHPRCSLLDFMTQCFRVMEGCIVHSLLT
jgi:hypothetical protein